MSSGTPGLHATRASKSTPQGPPCIIKSPCPSEVAVAVSPCPQTGRSNCESSNCRQAGRKRPPWRGPFCIGHWRRPRQPRLVLAPVLRAGHHGEGGKEGVCIRIMIGSTEPSSPPDITRRVGMCRASVLVPSVLWLQSLVKTRFYAMQWSLGIAPSLAPSGWPVATRLPYFRQIASPSQPHPTVRHAAWRPTGL